MSSLRIEFDPAKDAANVAKHGVSLALATVLFQGSVRLFADVRLDYGEPRFIAMGYVDKRLYVCVFTTRGTVHRIISLRKANRREQHAYKATAQSENEHR